MQVFKAGWVRHIEPRVVLPAICATRSHSTHTKVRRIRVPSADPCRIQPREIAAISVHIRGRYVEASEVCSVADMCLGVHVTRGHACYTGHVGVHAVHPRSQRVDHVRVESQAPVAVYEAVAAVQSDHVRHIDAVHAVAQVGHVWKHAVGAQVAFYLAVEQHDGLDLRCGHGLCQRVLFFGFFFGCCQNKYTVTVTVTVI